MLSDLRVHQFESKKGLVEMMGFEPTTSAVRLQRSPN
jgi:hypothetical protein